MANKAASAPKAKAKPFDAGAAAAAKEDRLKSLYDDNGTLTYQTRSEGALKFLEAQERHYKELQGEIGKAGIKMVEEAEKWAEEENEHLRKTLEAIGDPQAAWSYRENIFSRLQARFQGAGGIISSAEASNQSQVIAGLKSQTQAQMDLRDAIGAQGETIADMLPDLQAMMALYGPEQQAQIQAMIDKIQEWQATGQQKGWQAGMKAGLHEYSLAAVDTFATVKDATLKAMQNMEDGIINFAKTGKLESKSMANSIIDDLARMSIRAGITQPLAQMFGNWIGGVGKPANIAAFSSMDFGSISAFSTGFADGGIMSAAGPMPLRRYAAGGIADRPQVSLFGEGSLNEAYVPLPDGRSIPVTMQGGGGVTVHQTIQIDARGADAGVEQKIYSAMQKAKDAAVAEINNSLMRGGRTAKLAGVT